MNNNIKNEIIVKSNSLIEANYKLSLSEQRLIYILTSKINPKDTSFRTYRLSIKDFINVTGTKSKNIYSFIREISSTLRKKELRIKTENSFLEMNWLASCEYFENEGIVELEFSSKLIPYLLQLKEKFTILNLENLINFTSIYSMRIYELLKQYENLRSRTIYISGLKEHLGISINEYPKYANFKQKVILVAQKEINTKTDINFEFEEIKEGRKIIKIKFIITSKKQQTIPILLEEKNENTNKDSEIENIINQFKKKYNADLNFKLIENLVLEKSIDHVKDCLKKYDDYVCGDIKNIAGHFYKFVKGVQPTYGQI